MGPLIYVLKVTCRTKPYCQFCLLNPVLFSMIDHTDPLLSRPNKRIEEGYDRTDNQINRHISRYLKYYTVITGDEK